MADRVIIAGIRRGGTMIPLVELKQAAGRAGRLKEGCVEFVVGESDVEKFQEIFETSDDLEIKSVLSENIPFHLISEIVSGNVKNLNDAEQWYKRSFEYFSKGKCSLEKAIKELVNDEAIQITDNTFVSTVIGKISSRFYFDPKDVFYWKNNFELLFTKEIEKSEVAVAWALSNIPTAGHRTDNNQNFLIMFDEYKEQVRSLRLEHEFGAVTGFLYWSLMGGPRIGKFRGEIELAKNNFGRIYQALLQLNSFYEWDKKTFLEDLSIQIEYGIPQHLVSLCKIQGIGKIFALELYNIGVKCLDDIPHRLSSIESLGNERLLEVCKKICL